MTELLPRVDALIDVAPTDVDVASHRLELLAARRYRATGRPVPRAFVEEERLAAAGALTAAPLLERIGEACRQPMIVLKGPEVAAYYPEPLLRGFGDLDILVADAPAAQAALLRAGFQAIGDPDDYRQIHHLQPLIVDGLVLAVEIHARPKWPEGLQPPPFAELLAAAEPASSGPGGLHVLPPTHHAVLLAAHSWAHEPLRRLRDLLDIALLAAAAPEDPAPLARSWGLERIWRVTAAAIASVFGDGPRPLALRTWARNLPTARERTVFANHAEHWLSEFWGLPLPLAVTRFPGRAVADLGPKDSEPWGRKLRRSALAVRNARHGRSRHEAQVERREADDAG